MGSITTPARPSRLECVPAGTPSSHIVKLPGFRRPKSRFPPLPELVTSVEFTPVPVSLNE